MRSRAASQKSKERGKCTSDDNKKTFLVWLRDIHETVLLFVLFFGSRVSSLGRRSSVTPQKEIPFSLVNNEALQIIFFGLVSRYRFFPPIKSVE